MRGGRDDACRMSNSFVSLFISFTWQWTCYLWMSKSYLRRTMPSASTDLFFVHSPPPEKQINVLSILYRCSIYIMLENHCFLLYFLVCWHTYFDDVRSTATSRCILLTVYATINIAHISRISSKSYRYDGHKYTFGICYLVYFISFVSSNSCHDVGCYAGDNRFFFFFKTCMRVFRP